MKNSNKNTNTRILVIEAGRSEKHYWADVWRYRDLFYFLAWRDILVRYKQTAIGIAWALIRPLLTMIIFVFVFGHLAKLPSENAPYPILVFSALLPWQFFASAFTEASNSLITNSNMISKVYFPRIIVPISSVMVCCVDFLISISILLALMLWYQFIPNWTILLLPLFVLLVFALVLGTGLFIAALNVKYRDFRYIIPFIVQIGLYLSPVGFSSQIVPEQWHTFYALNPMVGIVEGFRFSILSNQTINYSQLYLSIIISLFFVFTGIYYFRKTEKRFADII